MSGSIEAPQPTQKEIETATVLQRVIAGEEFENKRAGDWEIFNKGRARLVGLHFYGDSTTDPKATFVFDIEKTRAGIPLVFYNTHRIVYGEKRQGTGTQALTSLQHSLQLVAREMGHAIVVEFPLDNQDDTQAWITTLGYQPSEHDAQIFSKTIAQSQ